MSALATEQRKHDRQEPGDCAIYFRADELEFDKEIHTPRFTSTQATEEQTERFIAELVASPDRDFFLEKNAGTFPRSASNEFELHLSVAEQWIKNKEAVGELVGPVFFRWAKNLTYTAMRFGWYPAQA